MEWFYVNPEGFYRGEINFQAEGENKYKCTERAE